MKKNLHKKVFQGFCKVSEDIFLSFHFIIVIFFFSLLLLLHLLLLLLSLLLLVFFIRFNLCIVIFWSVILIRTVSPGHNAWNKRMQDVPKTPRASSERLISFPICVLYPGEIFIAHTAWKVSKYRPEKNPFLDSFHTVLST